jgi:hypothetical protein
LIGEAKGGRIAQSRSRKDEVEWQQPHLHPNKKKKICGKTAKRGQKHKASVKYDDKQLKKSKKLT